MDFALSPKVQDLQRKVADFMKQYVYPIEHQVEQEMSVPGKEHTEPQVLKDVRAKAKAAGLWNLFLPDEAHGKGLKVSEYAPLSEINVLNQQRLPGSEQSSFLVWFEGHSQALAIAPSLPRGTESNSALNLSELLSIAAG